MLKSLNELVHNKAKQAVDYILANDKETLEKLFKDNPSLKCTDKHLNINLLQIGAISGNRDIFSFLLTECDNLAYSSKDKVSGLKLSDFAYLSFSKHIATKLAEKGQNIEPSFKVPGWVESVSCSPIGALYIAYNLLTISSITAGVKLYSKLSTPKDISLQKSFVIALATDISLNAIKEVTKYIGSDKFQICQNYDNYQKVETTNPKNFNSLAQFEKFALEHKNVYVTLNSECKAGYKNIAKIEIPILDYDANNLLLFGLCEQFEDGRDL